jgi:hypothetical protein
MEIWKDVKGYENIYKVSNQGRIKSIERYIKHSDGRKPQYHKELIRKPQLSNKGYLNIRLSKENKLKSYLVHKLVAEAFIPNTDNKQQVNHKDGNKENNNDWNLEWVTNSENQIHALKFGLKIPFTRKVAKMNLEGEILKVYDSIKSVKKDGFTSENVVSICKGTYGRYTHHGFKWKYID